MLENATSAKNCEKSIYCICNRVFNYKYLLCIYICTVDSGYKGMLNRGNSGYRGQFAADQNFYLVKAGQIEEKGAF